MSAILTLAWAHARRRPARFIVACAGAAVAVAFAAAVLGESTLAGDRAARDTLAQASPVQRAVRVTWSDPVTPAVERQARGVMAAAGLPAQSEAVLFSPIRLSGSLVQLAAVAPLGGWSSGARRIGACTAGGCPMLLAAGGLRSGALSAAGIRVSVIGAASVGSAIPLGISPSAGGPVLLVSGDVGGLERLPALGGLYRVHSWAATLPAGRLNSWEIPQLERRLQRAQATLTAADSSFSLSAPFELLETARARAAAAPRHLLLAGGGALAALAAFIVLAAGALRREHRAELSRLRLAGARPSQGVMLSLIEAGWVAAVATSTGLAIAIVVCWILAAHAGLPSGAAVAHAFFRPLVVLALPATWLSATVALAMVAGSSQRWLLLLADASGVAAVAALAAALALGAGHGALALLLAPLACAASGVALLRGTAVALRLVGRLARRAPPLARVAGIGLARGPGLASLSIAFTAISVGFGGFALCFRATFERQTADQAADRVPLDATVAPGADFATPLQLAPLSRWHALAGGLALAVRRTEASYPSGESTTTVPALGVPASGLRLMHGWRASDGSEPLAALARKLVSPAPVRQPGPELPAGSHWLAVRGTAPDLGVEVTAALRRTDGSVKQLAVGELLPRPRTLRAVLPAGRYELEAVQLAVPPGTEATEGHQHAENPVSQPELATPVALASLSALDRQGRVLAALPTNDWRGAGAARVRHSSGSGIVASFSAAGPVGWLRPSQPSDSRPVPVLADPATAVAAGPGDQLPLTLDGLPVATRVVGVLRRFPTLPADAAGFVVADTSELSAALDAQSPGQGMANEVWLSVADPHRLRRALASQPLIQLSSSFRSDLQGALREDPVARAVTGTLEAAAALMVVLALAGAVAMAADSRPEAGLRHDLAEIGLGPLSLRRELRLRLALAAALGLLAGIGVAVVLTVLAVPALRGVLGSRQPPAVTVVPVAALALWCVAALATLGVGDWLASARRM